MVDAEMETTYVAEETYVCGVCKKPILPGMRFEYQKKECTDREGRTAWRMSKAHRGCIRTDNRTDRHK